MIGNNILYMISGIIFGGILGTILINIKYHYFKEES